MRRRCILCLLLILLLTLPPGPARSGAAAPVAFWRTAGHAEASSWQWTARSGFLGLGLEVWESGQVASPGQGTVRGTYTDTGLCRVAGSYQEQRRARGDDVVVQRVYHETFVDAYPQSPGDDRPNERTWTVAGTARTIQTPLSPLYGRPALPASAGLVRRAQTAPRRVRPLVQTWAGARHQAAGLRDHLVTTGSSPDRLPIPWIETWTCQGPPRRYRSAIPGVAWSVPAGAASHTSSTPVQVTVPPNLPWGWRAHHGPLLGAQVVNVVPGGRAAPPAIPALGPWRLTLETTAHVFAVDGAAEVCLPPHAELLLAWWGLMPLGPWEPGAGLWGRFLAQNGALREWGLEKEPGASWSVEWAALVQRNRLRWADEDGIIVNGWRCAVDLLAARP